MVARFRNRLTASYSSQHSIMSFCMTNFTTTPKTVPVEGIIAGAEETARLDS